MQSHALVFPRATASPDSPQGNKYTENHRSRRGIKGGGLLHYWHFGWFGAALPRHLDFGIFLEAREDPQKIIFEGDSKTTYPVVAKSYKKQKKTSSWFYHCHPYPSFHRSMHHLTKTFRKITGGGLVLRRRLQRCWRGGNGASVAFRDAGGGGCAVALLGWRQCGVAKLG
jgi:hypothetical protein